MALLLFAALILLPLLAALWAGFGVWLWRRNSRWLSGGCLLFTVLALCFLFQDSFPVFGHFFRPGGPASGLLGPYLLVNLCLLVAGLPLWHFIHSSIGAGGGDAH